MSAYMMTQEETLAIAKGIKGMQYGAQEFADVDLETLAICLFRLNAQSVTERYGANAEEMGVSDAFVIPSYTRVKNLDRKELLDLLGCWLYQSCEGGCNKSALYIAIELATGRLARRILQEMDNYNNQPAR